jgi:ubiquinone/menaquinone biosynthesis C-methylase UbiE
MLPADVEHYLAEIRRVLKPKGRCLISYFLLTDESKQLLQAGKIDSRFGTPDFRYEFPGYRTVSQEIPEQAVAYDERWIRDLYDRMGLQIQHVSYGSWCGRERCRSYQDLILAV